MNGPLRLCLLFLVLILASCNDESYRPIKETNSIFVTVNIKDMSLSFIDSEKQKQIARWEMEKPYSGGVILPGKETLLLYGKQVSTVDIYSLSKGRKTASWNIGKGIVNAKVINGEKAIAFADQERNAIRFFNLSGKEISEVETENNPLTMAVGKNGKRLYVTSFNSDVLTVIDLERMERIKGFSIHSSAAGMLVENDRNELWIGGHGEGARIEDSVHIYDLTTGQLKKKASMPVMPVNFLEKDNNIYVLSHGSSMLYKLNNRIDIVESTKVGANPFEMKFVDDLLVVAGYDSNDIHFINPDSLAIIKTIKVGRGPFQIIIGER